MPPTIQIKKKYNKVVQGLQTKYMRQPLMQIATDMGMSEHELHEWEQAFRPTHMNHWPMFMTNIQFGMRLKEDNPEEKLGNEELKSC